MDCQKVCTERESVEEIAANYFKMGMLEEDIEKKRECFKNALINSRKSDSESSIIIRFDSSMKLAKLMPNKKEAEKFLEDEMYDIIEHFDVFGKTRTKLGEFIHLKYGIKLEVKNLDIQ